VCGSGEHYLLSVNVNSTVSVAVSTALCVGVANSNFQWLKLRLP
jgi:hypothetical protein